MGMKGKETPQPISENKLDTQGVILDNVNSVSKSKCSIRTDLHQQGTTRTILGKIQKQNPE
jgi:hypothetical protein